MAVQNGARCHECGERWPNHKLICASGLRANVHAATMALDKIPAAPKYEDQHHRTTTLLMPKDVKLEDGFWHLPTCAGCATPFGCSPQWHKEELEAMAARADFIPPKPLGRIGGPMGDGPSILHDHTREEPCTTKCRAHPAWEAVRGVFAESPPKGSFADARPGEGVARRMDMGKAPVLQGFIRYFARAIVAVSYVSEYGERKYAMPGKPSYSPAWQDMADGEARSGDSEARHMLKPVFQGDYDDESELAHLAHKAWNALAELEMALKTKRVQCRVGNVIVNGKPQAGTSKLVELDL